MQVSGAEEKIWEQRHGNINWSNCIFIIKREMTGLCRVCFNFVLFYGTVK